MLTQTKGKQVRLYVYKEDEGALDQLSKATGLNVTTIMTMIVSAGLKAASEAGNRLPLPLKFKLQEEELAPGPARLARVSRRP